MVFLDIMAVDEGVLTCLIVADLHVNIPILIPNLTMQATDPQRSQHNIRPRHTTFIPNSQQFRTTILQSPTQQFVLT